MHEKLSHSCNLTVSDGQVASYCPVCMFIMVFVRACVCVSTPQAAIRKELNEFKSREMEVHEDSKQFTRYWPLNNLHHLAQL